MAFIDLFRHTDINRGIEEYENTEGAVLLDVRSPQEYQAGHIPGSINIPLPDIDEIHFAAEDMDTPLFVYCHSGARSRQAVHLLEFKGYSKVKNIGGIVTYSGKLAR